jgi:hypothetical protein
MLLTLKRPSNGQQKRSVLQSFRVALSSARQNANATSNTILQESISEYSGIAVALNARGQAGCKSFVKPVYWSKFEKRSDGLGCKASVRLTVSVAAVGLGSLWMDRAFSRPNERADGLRGRASEFVQVHPAISRLCAASEKPVRAVSHDKSGLASRVEFSSGQRVFHMPWRFCRQT